MSWDQQIEYFNQKCALEESAMLQILEWLKTFNFQLVYDVRKDPNFQSQDIDLLMQDKDGVFGRFGVEIKVRGKKRDDIIVETLSNVERKTQGNLFKTQALFFAYVFFIEGKLKQGYLLHVQTLREWFIKNRHKYTPKYAPNPPQNPIYHTEFYPIPITDIKGIFTM